MSYCGRVKALQSILQTIKPRAKMIYIYIFFFIFHNTEGSRPFNLLCCSFLEALQYSDRTLMYTVVLQLPGKNMVFDISKGVC